MFLGHGGFVNTFGEDADRDEPGHEDGEEYHDIEKDVGDDPPKLDANVDLEACVLVDLEACVVVCITEVLRALVDNGHGLFDFVSLKFEVMSYVLLLNNFIIYRCWINFLRFLYMVKSKEVVQSLY